MQIIITKYPLNVKNKKKDQIEMQDKFFVCMQFNMDSPICHYDFFDTYLCVCVYIYSLVSLVLLYG